MELTDDDELINEFMGFTLRVSETYGRLWSHPQWPGEYGEKAMPMRYGTSWDCLMPVVEKINSMMPEIKMPRDLESMKAGTHGSEKYIDVLSLPLSTPISEAYGEIVKFIKWYKSVQQ